MKYLIMIALIVIIVAVSFAGGSNLYRMFRLDGYSELQTKEFMELPRVQSQDFSEEVKITESCLLVSQDFRVVFLFSIDDSCNIVIEKLLDNRGKR